MDTGLLLDLLQRFEWLGNWLFFVLAFVESAPFVGVFVPGATLISVGGFLASQGYLHTWKIVIFAGLGAIVGDFFSYSMGRWGGDFIKRKGAQDKKLIRHGEAFFKKHGNKSIFLGRFFGPIRAIIPFIAGLSKMKRRPFIFWNFVSAIGWAMLNVFLGYFSGTLVSTIFRRWSKGLTLMLIILFIVAIAYWIIKKKGQSIRASFKEDSLRFRSFLNNKSWFRKFIGRYPIIKTFFEEYKNANEKLFGGTLIVSFLIITYILVLILDIF